MEEQCALAYGLNLRRCEYGTCKTNCKHNSFCLNRLGEHKWLGTPSVAFILTASDRLRQRRKSGSHVGLKNLGATCYANSFFQLWFHNTNLRRMIYLWNPLEDPVESKNATLKGVYVPATFLGKLQATFALMQAGRRQSIDPSSLITCLKSDTTMQEDVQEFSQVMLTKTEQQLQYQSSSQVQNFLKDNFLVEYSYITRCMKCKNETKCPSSFYELHLQMKDQKTIDECLNAFMKEELLEGENQYFCDECKSKENAQRYVVFTSLPPVLNIQLLRYTYDKRTKNNRKINSFIQFPEKLNMADYCDLDGNLEYNLSAVLIHGGRSANYGHYIAQIFDHKTKTWNNFSDQTVKIIDGDSMHVGDDDGRNKKVRGCHTPPGFHRSMGAYMLVYTRVGDPNRFEIDANEGLRLAPHLQKLVSDDNAQFETLLSTPEEVVVVNPKKIAEEIEMASTITMMVLDPDSQTFDAIPTTWLVQFLSEYNRGKRIENEKFTCVHGKLDPLEVMKVKYINSDLADMLYDKYGGGPRLQYDALKCVDCVRTKWKAIKDLRNIPRNYRTNKKLMAVRPVRRRRRRNAQPRRRNAQPRRRGRPRIVRIVCVSTADNTNDVANQVSTEENSSQAEAGDERLGEQEENHAADQAEMEPVNEVAENSAGDLDVSSTTETSTPQNGVHMENGDNENPSLADEIQVDSEPQENSESQENNEPHFQFIKLDETEESTLNSEVDMNDNGVADSAEQAEYYADDQVPLDLTVRAQRSRYTLCAENVQTDNDMPVEQYDDEMEPAGEMEISSDPLPSGSQGNANRTRKETEDTEMKMEVDDNNE